MKLNKILTKESGEVCNWLAVKEKSKGLSFLFLFFLLNTIFILGIYASKS